MAHKVSFLDRFAGYVSPRWALGRMSAQVKLHQVRAEYDGATMTRRAAGWKRSMRDANGELTARVRQVLNASAHDLVRNNPHGARAVGLWADHLVGAGITFRVLRNGKFDQELNDVARAHMDSTSIDAEGQSDLYALQHLAARSIVTSGAVLVRRRWRRKADGLPLPFQVQILEPEYLDPGKDGQTKTGHQIAGIEFDAIGRRKSYWLYSGHPGSRRTTSLSSREIPASEVIHAYRKDRPEQQHGATWFTPIILPLNDWGELTDAYRMRQKIAASHVGVIFDDPPAQGAGEKVDPEPMEQLEPGMIYYAGADAGEAGKMMFNKPPSVEGIGDFTKVSMREISVGMELPSMMLSGDYSDVSFISGRLALLPFRITVETRQYAIFVRQFGEGVGRWLIEALAMAGYDVTGVTVEWSPPPVAMASPETELPAVRDAIRGGQLNLGEWLRSQGKDPDRHFADRAADNAALDSAKIILDSDPRHVTAVGNAVQLNIDPDNKGKQK
jgi:lambda family phage portal protein